MTHQEAARVLGRAIRGRRRELDQTQGALAEELGCSQGQLSSFEAGKTIPKAEILLAINGCLGTAFAIERRTRYVVEGIGEEADPPAPPDLPAAVASKAELETATVASVATAIDNDPELGQGVDMPPGPKRVYEVRSNDELGPVVFVVHANDYQWAAEIIANRLGGPEAKAVRLNGHQDLAGKFQSCLETDNGDNSPVGTAFHITEIYEE